MRVTLFSPSDVDKVMMVCPAEKEVHSSQAHFIASSSLSPTLYWCSVGENKKKTTTKNSRGGFSDLGPV